MPIKQNLNNYTDKYNNSVFGEVLETENYIFHYFSNSIAEKEIKNISEIQENAYKKIVEDLKLENINQKIKYYIYNTEEDKKELMGDDGYAQAVWHDNSIHIVYNEKIKPIGAHEDTHLLTLSWGVAIGFFQEGLAEYMCDCLWGNKKLQEEKIIKDKQEKIPDLINMLEHKFWMENSNKDFELYYSWAGTFTNFLFKKFGLEKYKNFYMSISRTNKQEENLIFFEKIFGKIDIIQRQYFEYINSNL